MVSEDEEEQVVKQESCVTENQEVRAQNNQNESQIVISTFYNNEHKPSQRQNQFQLDQHQKTVKQEQYFQFFLFFSKTRD